jgi:hypothetical protein
VLLLAGVYLSILRLPQLNDLWTTGYGQVLLVKIGLVSLALRLGRRAQARRCAGSRARKTGVFAGCREPDRREHGRDGRPARGGDARRCEAARTAAPLSRRH